MRINFEQSDLEAIADIIFEKIKPLLLNGNGKQDRWLDMGQLAEYLGVAYSTIANNKKHLPHTYFNGKPLFKQSEIDSYLEQYRAKPAKKLKNQKFFELFNSSKNR